LTEIPHTTSVNKRMCFRRISSPFSRHITFKNGLLEEPFSRIISRNSRVSWLFAIPSHVRSGLSLLKCVKVACPNVFKIIVCG